MMKLLLISIISLSNNFVVAAVITNEYEQALCPRPHIDSGLFELSIKTQNLLKDVEKFIEFKNASKAQATKIHKIDYKRSKVATYCKRPESIVNTVVFHHTAMRKETTPQFINEIHLDKGVDEGDPWYMIGYNYVISQSYNSESVSATMSNPQVFEGRPPEIRGAHAGGYTTPLTDQEKEYYQKIKIQCGNKTQGFKETTALSQVNNKGEISGNLISYGVALIGNYEEIKYETIGGIKVPVSLNRTPGYPPKETPSFYMLEKSAKLICDLQKKNPRITKIVPHSYFKNTDCPGTLIYNLYEIKAMAKLYGCDFEVQIEKGEK